MSDNYEYLNIENNDKQVLKHLAEMGEQLKKLKQKYLEAEETAKHAKNEYDHFANTIIPNEMAACGITSITLLSGGELKLKHNYYCQPNKNPEDKKLIAGWLRDNGGEHVLDNTLTVSGNDMTKLDDNNIAYSENVAINTNRLKSFIKDGIGATSGIQRFTVDDIPKEIHFCDVLTVDITGV